MRFYEICLSEEDYVASIFQKGKSWLMQKHNSIFQILRRFPTVTYGTVGNYAIISTTGNVTWISIYSISKDNKYDICINDALYIHPVGRAKSTLTVSPAKG